MKFQSEDMIAAAQSGRDLLCEVSENRSRTSIN